jgi:hypothetical protein
MNTVFDKPLTVLLDEAQIAESGYELVIASHCLEHMSDLGKEIGTAAARAVCWEGEKGSEYC